MMESGRSLAERIDPELQRNRDAFLNMLGPKGFFGIRELSERRRRYEDFMGLAAARAPDQSRVAREDREIPGTTSDRRLAVRVYRAAGLADTAPGLLYIHGGGMIMGSIAAEDGFAAVLSEAVGAVVVSVEYGLAPEHAGTGPVEDCFSALAWLHREASGIGVDPERLGIFGVSAGGGLACGTALLARDRGGPPLRCQMLIYPMLDDSNATPSSHAVVDLGLWDRAANLEAWSLLLGDKVGTDRVSPYSAPARADDLTGLPPTYIDIGDLDLFSDEVRTMAARLQSDGVPVEFHEYPGAFHGFDQLAPKSGVAKRAEANRVAALKRLLSPSDSPQPIGKTT